MKLRSVELGVLSSVVQIKKANVKQVVSYLSLLYLRVNIPKDVEGKQGSIIMKQSKRK